MKFEHIMTNQNLPFIILTIVNKVIYGKSLVPDCTTLGDCKDNTEAKLSFASLAIQNKKAAKSEINRK